MSVMITHGFHPASFLQRLVQLRWAAILAQALVLSFTVGWLRMPLLVAPMAAGVLVLIVANLMTLKRLQSPRPVSDGELFGQICLDVLVLEWLLYFSGGSSNPFISLLLLPLTITAVAMGRRYVWAMAGVCFGAYTLLVFFNLPLPPLPPRLLTLEEVLAETCGMDHGSPQSGFALHMLGMWLNFSISALIVAVFLSRQAQALRQRDKELQAYREQALRNEQVLALGLLSAGAAHKLGTPLSTLAVLSRELERSQPQNTELAEDARLIREQVERCKGILSDMVSSVRGAPQISQALPQWLEQVIDEWHLLRPKVPRPQLKISQESDSPPPQIRPDRGLSQALQNLLNNAADAHPEDVSLLLAWDAAQVSVEILDRGPGVAPEIVDLLGQSFVPQDADGSKGLGIGFFLTNATIERFEGEVEVFSREGGGTCTRVTLPLSALAGMP